MIVWVQVENVALHETESRRRRTGKLLVDVDLDRQAVRHCASCALYQYPNLSYTGLALLQISHLGLHMESTV